MHFYDPKGKLKERSNFQRLMSIKKVTSVNDAVSKINYFSKDLLVLGVLVLGCFGTPGEALAWESEK